MAYPLILIETPLVVHVCIFKYISVFVFQFLNNYDVESGVFESFIVGNISLNKGLMLETQGSMVFEGWEENASLVLIHE